jgi:hypothetical protein
MEMSRRLWCKSRTQAIIERHQVEIDVGRGREQCVAVPPARHREMVVVRVVDTVSSTAVEAFMLIGLPAGRQPMTGRPHEPPC